MDGIYVDVEATDNSGKSPNKAFRSFYSFQKHNETIYAKHGYNRTKREKSRSFDAKDAFGIARSSMLVCKQHVPL